MQSVGRGYRPSGFHNIGGPIEVINLPIHFYFTPNRLSPEEVRAEYRRLGWQRIVGFQTRNPIYRPQFEMTTKAMRNAKANLVLMSVVGMTKKDDFDHFTGEIGIDIIPFEKMVYLPTLLDGDIVRRNLSSELSFSKAHRNINALRIGFVASEITKNRGVAICAPIAPYEETRREIRSIIEAYGGFIEVHVATPIEECEKRDRKGMYAKARAGLVNGFSGMDAPYEIPVNPEVTVDTTNITPEKAAQEVMLAGCSRELYVGARNLSPVWCGRIGGMVFGFWP